MRNILFGLMMAICGMMISCDVEPEPINFGTDVCTHCKMAIMDNKFGAEIVSVKGKIFKFDATECMVDFIKEKPDLNVEVSKLLTINIASPGTLINAREAIFLKDKAFRSPMGANLASFHHRQLAENNRQNADAKIFTWNELIQHRQINLALNEK
ncbi:MAG: nitrous oxide reductase accessory protein NosL [Sphingobacteriaceae bacterium]|nr:nitrous oxide reductase accessory protein NosL [Sphingobacteriaceae bacterium]